MVLPCSFAVPHTPSRKDGISPAQKLYGHPVQYTASAPSLLFTRMEVQEQAKQILQSQKLLSTHAHPLPDIHIGFKCGHSKPQIQTLGHYGTLLTSAPSHHYVKTSMLESYVVRNHQPPYPFVQKVTSNPIQQQIIKILPPYDIPMHETANQQTP